MDVMMFSSTAVLVLSVSEVRVFVLTVPNARVVNSVCFICSRCSRG